MEIQIQNASLPPARPRTRTSIADTIQDRRASPAAVSELSIRTLHLVMDGIVSSNNFIYNPIFDELSVRSYCGNYVVGLYLIPNDELR